MLKYILYKGFRKKISYLPHTWGLKDLKVRFKSVSIWVIYIKRDIIMTSLKVLRNKYQEEPHTKAMVEQNREELKQMVLRNAAAKKR